MIPLLFRRKKITSAEFFKLNGKTNQMAQRHIKHREAIVCIDACIQVQAPRFVQPQWERITE